MSNSKTVFRGQVSILNGPVGSTRYGSGDLLLPEGIINVTGRSGADNNISALGSGAVNLSSVNGSIALNTTGSGSINLNTTGSGLVSVNSATTFAAVAATSATVEAPIINLNTTNATITTTSSTGNIALTSTAGTAGNISISTANTNASGGNITISTTASNATGGLVTISTTNSTLNPGINITTLGSSINIGTSNNAAVNIGSGGVLGSMTTVGGDLTVAGNLTVNGTTTSVNTETVTIEDNILLLNSNVASTETSVDAGLLVKRYQVPNDAGEGAIVNGGNPTHVGSVQALPVATTTQITLSPSASSVVNDYVGGWIHITSGATALNNVRLISAYNATTKVLTVATAFANAPVTGNTYNIFSDKVYTGLVYQESSNRWVIGGTETDPGRTAVTNLTPEDLLLRNLYVTGSISGAIKAFTTSTVILNLNSSAPVAIPNITKLFGSGLLFVGGNDSGDASAVFVVSKSVTAESGQTQRLTSSSNDESNTDEVDVEWPSSGLTLRHVLGTGINSQVTYNVVLIVV